MVDDATLPEVFRGIQRLEGGMQGMDRRIQNIEDQVHGIGLDVAALKVEMRAHIATQTERTRARDVRCTDHALQAGELDARLRAVETIATNTTATVVERWRLPNWVAYAALSAPVAALLWDILGRPS